MYRSTIIVLCFTSLAIQVASISTNPPEISYPEISVTVEEVFKVMIEEGLHKAKPETDKSSIASAYRHIYYQGVTSLEKNPELLSIACFLTNECNKDRSFKHIRKEAYTLVDRKSSIKHRIGAWNRVQRMAYIRLAQVSEQKIPSLDFFSDFSENIEKNSGINLSYKNRQLFLAMHLAIAASMQALYQEDPESFNELFKKELNKIESRWCTIL